MEIAYKIWDTKLNEWCGADIQLLKPDGNVVTAEFNPLGQVENYTLHISNHPDSRFIVCLFTGVCDKWGNRIYDGSILSYNIPDTDEKEIYKVYWLDHGFMARTINGTYGENGLIECDQDMEVIGHIYTHPHLLEVPAA